MIKREFYHYIFICFCLIFSISCSTSQSNVRKNNKEIVILHTNDTHSQLEPVMEKAMKAEVGGVLRRMEYVEQVRKNNKTVFLFDAGDFSQGTPYYNLFKGVPDIFFFNQIGYDVVTLGNHEFDEGVQNLANRLKNANFQVVCANYSFKNTDLQKIVKPYVILNKDDIKVGVFGLTIDLHGLSASNNLFDTITYHDAIETAQKMVTQLQNEKCDLIICLSHLGITPDDTTPDNPMCDKKLANEVKGIDIIIGGHSHEVVDTIINGTRIVQNDDKGGTIGRFALKQIE